VSVVASARTQAAAESSFDSIVVAECRVEPRRIIEAKANGHWLAGIFPVVSEPAILPKQQNLAIVVVLSTIPQR